MKVTSANQIQDNRSSKDLISISEKMANSTVFWAIKNVRNRERVPWPKKGTPGRWEGTKAEQK